MAWLLDQCSAVPRLGTDGLCSWHSTAPAKIRAMRQMIGWVRSAMLSFDPPLKHLQDITIPQCVQNAADEAIRLIRKHHDSWLCERQS